KAGAELRLVETEDYEKYPARSGRERIRGLLSDADGNVLVTSRNGLRLQRIGKEVANLLLDVVFVDGEIRLFEVGDGLPVLGEHADVEGHDGCAAPKDRIRLLRRLCRY